jgi:hypothetical protein
VRAAFVFAVIACCLSLLDQPSRAATEIPCDYRAGMIWMQVRATGQARPLNFLLDSGAGSSVLDVACARGLGLKLGRAEAVQGVGGRCTAYRVNGFTAEVGGLPVAASLLALDLGSISASCGRAVDALLGLDFFRGRVVQIDYAAGKIRLLGRDEIPAAGAQILRLTTRHDVLCVRVGVNGSTPQWMRLDTGCSSGVEWVAGRGSAREHARTSVAAAVGSRRSIEAEVVLGAERLPGVKVGLHDAPIFAGESGLLGNGLLSKFRVTVDAAKSRLILSPRD